MPRKFVSEYVSRHLCGVRVLGSATDLGAVSPVIGTHNGTFHCDEAMACGMLKCTSQFAPAHVFRSRDNSALEKCAVVVDVGSVYDAAAMRFDHHQPSFHGTMTTAKKTYQTRLSSAGLVYKHFGREIIQQYVHSALDSPYREQLLQMCNWDANKRDLSDRELDNLFDVVYRNFVEHIDGIDNGVNAFGPAIEEGDSSHSIKETSNPNNACVRKYSVTSTLSDRVGGLAPWWNEEGNGDGNTENAVFVEAMRLATREFFEAVHYYAFAWMPARGIVERAFLAAESIHPSGRIVVLSERFCPWKDHLLEIEEEYGKTGHVLYLIFSDKKNWRVQAVPKEMSGFENRQPLPWRGLRDAELSQASGIDGCIFVHVSGFIGGNQTYEGVMQMAIKALSLGGEEGNERELKRERENK